MTDSRTSLIFINSLIFMATAIGSKARWAPGRRRRKGWAAAGPQRPAYSGRGHIVSPRAQLVTHAPTVSTKRVRRHDTGLSVYLSAGCVK